MNKDKFHNVSVINLPLHIKTFIGSVNFIDILSIMLFFIIFIIDLLIDAYLP